MTYETLDVHREGPVGWLIFDRPDAGNAMDAVMLGELEHAWRELDADPAVRVIVNTGNGRAFQTGLDVAQFARDAGALREQARRTRDSELRLTAWHNRVGKPVLAAVNGVCAGGGLHFVADADIVIAAARSNVPRSARVDRAGRRPSRPSRWRSSPRWKRSPAWRWSVGTNGSMRSGRWTRDPLRGGPDRGSPPAACPGTRRDDREATPRRRWRPRNARCGARWNSG